MVLLAIVTIEMLFVSLPLVASAFPLNPPENLLTDNPDFIQFYSADPYVSQYPNLLQNLGTLNCYERLRLVTSVSPQFVDGEPYQNFIGNAYIAETNQSVELSYFSPNEVRVSLAAANITEPATLVLNQNFYKGWKVSNDKLISHNGLLAAEITPIDDELVFNYKPRSFVIGTIISVVTLLLLLLLFFKPKLLRKLLFQSQS